MDQLQGDLFSLLARIPNVPDATQKVYLLKQCHGLFTAVETLHQSNILHRDLKPENILFDIYGRLYISDYGLSKRREWLQDNTMAKGGTIRYLLHNNPSRKKQSAVSLWENGKKADIYAISLVIYQVNTAKEIEEVPLSSFKLDLMGNIVRGRANPPKGNFEKRTERMRDTLTVRDFTETYAEKVRTHFNLFNPLRSEQAQYETLVAFKDAIKIETGLQVNKQRSTKKQEQTDINKAHRKTIETLKKYETKTESKKIAIANLCKQLELTKTISQYGQLSGEEKEKLADTIREILVGTNRDSSLAKRFQHFCHDTVADYLRYAFNVDLEN